MSEQQKYNLPKEISNLKQKLNNPRFRLPGGESHKKMVPMIKGKPFRNMNPPDGTRQSAVMILLIGMPEISNFEILFTLRHQKMRSHSGQISFPGGRLDDGENHTEAALRETQEEVGIRSDDIQIIGKISTLYVPPSSSNIQPIVGYIPEIEKLTLSAAEVEEAFTVKISDLQNDELRKWKPWEFNGGIKADVPYFDIHPKVPLWGATAIMMSEFLDVF
jgi:8-oxo-dGTP pyrophosphatase MutT (NUDIX family)